MSSPRAGDQVRQGVELPAEVFDVQVNIPLIHQVVVAQLAAARQGTATRRPAARSRGGGRKPYRQKGTGRARQGSIRAPQFAGGGVVHGPTPRDYAQRTPKKMKAAALRGALSDRARERPRSRRDRARRRRDPSTKAAVASARSASPTAARARRARARRRAGLEEPAQRSTGPPAACPTSSTPTTSWSRRRRLHPGRARVRSSWTGARQVGEGRASSAELDRGQRRRRNRCREPSRSRQCEEASA